MVVLGGGAVSYAGVTPVWFKGSTRNAADVAGNSHPGVELRVNLKSISHRCHLFEVEFVWELTKATIHLPLG